MARHAVVSVADLAAGVVLAPERYDPARRPAVTNGRPLAELVTLVRDSVRPVADERDLRRCLLFDTGDAQSGFLHTSRAPLATQQLGSSKRLILPGDVLISRLRPYLRQVAWVDPELATSDIRLCCSTEFYALRGRDGQDIAFVVPWLLSAPIQTALAAAQEGGHHPRFDRSALLELPVADHWLRRRAALSAEVVAAVASMRKGKLSLAALSADERP